MKPTLISVALVCTVLAACATGHGVAGGSRMADTRVRTASASPPAASTPTGLAPGPSPALRPATAPPDWLPTSSQVAAAAGATRTCHQGRGPGVPRTADQCVRWTASGPVNVVIVSRDADPTAAVARVWQPAAGNWLVAEANLGGRHCQGWTPSQRQFQVRLTSVSRRHIKLVAADCAFPGLHAQVGDAHTDVYDRKRCAGDHMVDMAAARDALVAGLSRLPGVRVTYVQVRPPRRYPGGCDLTVVDDGRVALIALS